ncbi:MBL fold metallo-hydrolase [Reichenbachiella sp.]|uniref:MBL fold metallo-hydrolase n=1 Tax=Reichenbachiella sp. TaxID=2184521 RepID=UPI003298ED27
MLKILKMTLLSIIIAIVAVIILVIAFFKTAPQIGAKPEGVDLKGLQLSDNYKEDKFVNQFDIEDDFPLSKSISIMYKFIMKKGALEPDKQVLTTRFDKQSWVQRNEEEILLAWFGHSSALIKMDGKTILADPVFGERASMFSFMGPKKFDYSNYMDVDQLPEVDLVIISHDHYDHLDYPTILALKDHVSLFYVPLGVASHLEKWGIPAEHIKTFDWWESQNLSEDLKLTFAPTQHFSGRGLNDKFSTLWGSWVIEGSVQKMYFSGDSGYFPGFKEIGEKFGPFDFALVECGAYNAEDWGDIHMLPEKSVQAALDVKAKIAMPIHWGKFDLALHPWKEPVQRFLKAAKINGLQTHTPVVGDILSIPAETGNSNWWEAYQ